MPVAKNPSAREFFVYTLEARGVPFYVGIGRAARASDRVRYVHSLIKREASGKQVNWCLSNRAVAEFLNRGDVLVRHLHEGLTRNKALILERQEISRLVTSGIVLANYQHNPRRPACVEDVVRSVLSASKRTSDATTLAATAGKSRK